MRHRRSLLLVPAVALGLLAGQGASAQSGATEAEQPPRPSKNAQRTRAEVRAECEAARKAGTMPSVECPNPAANTPSTRSRAEVRAECEAARRAGTMPKAECGPN
jgi:hypothetical protein